MTHLPNPLDRDAYRPGQADVVILDQQTVVERQTVVDATAGSHRIFLEDAEGRCGLAGIKDRCPTIRRVNEASRQRGRAGHPLQEVERGALGGQQGRGESRDANHGLTRLAPVTVLAQPRHLGMGIELAERLEGHLDSGEHPGRLDHHLPDRPLLARHRRVGRHIAPAHILR